MSVAQSLDTPFERLNLLPTSMNYIGGWESGKQYFKNDVVLSSINYYPYILTGSTSIVSLVDPSLVPLVWYELAKIVSGGVLSVGQGDYILVDNTDPKQPIITNNGVVRLQYDPAGISNIGTEQNPLLINNGVLNVIPNPFGLTSTKFGTGLFNLASNGVTSLRAGDGISVTGSKVDNTGVLNVTYGYGISNTGTDKNPIINAATAIVTPVIVGSSASMSPPTVEQGAVGVVAPILQTAQVFQKYIAEGPPTPGGYFIVDFSAWTFKFTQSSSPSPTKPFNKVLVKYIDSAAQKSYSSGFSIIELTIGNPSIVGADYPFSVNGGQDYLDIDAARDAGLTKIDGIGIFNQVGAIMTLISPATTYATYNDRLIVT